MQVQEMIQRVLSWSFTQFKTIIQYCKRDSDVGTIKIQKNSLCHHKNLSCYPVLDTPTSLLFRSPPPLVLNPLQPLMHFYNFVISRILYNWNHWVCNFLGLFFFTQHNSLELFPSSWMYQYFIPFDGLIKWMYHNL